MSKVDESDALHARAREFVAAFERGDAIPEPFDALAKDVADFQARHNAAYARLRAARGEEIPAVPTDAFKFSRVSTFEKNETPIVFRTSGTTAGASARGAHWFRTCATYDAGSVAFGRVALGVRAKTSVLVLGPSPREQPDSSLTHMIARFVSEIGDGVRDEETYFVKDGVIDLVAFDDRVAHLLVASKKNTPPPIVLGTALAFVHLLEGLGDDVKFRMPEGARVMQTGGFKGKTREVDGATLRKEMARLFCIDERAVVSEYGMTELSSQFWEGAEKNIYVEPPWARVVAVDPISLAPVRDGEIGIARIEDLLNVDSAVALLAADRVRRIGGGFELLGRAEGAPPRGCSISIDEMLGDE
jgi:hypothetical protein